MLEHSVSCAMAVLAFVLLQPHLRRAFGLPVLAVAVGFALIGLLVSGGLSPSELQQMFETQAWGRAWLAGFAGLICGLVSGAIASVMAYGSLAPGALMDDFAPGGSELAQRCVAIVVVYLGFATGAHWVWLEQLKELTATARAGQLWQLALALDPRAIASATSKMLCAALAGASPVLLTSMAIGIAQIAVGGGQRHVDSRGLAAMRWPLAFFGLVASWQTYPDAWAQMAFYWPLGDSEQLVPW